MRRQVGDLALDGYGLARRGLLVRHLVLLSGDLANTEAVLAFLGPEISIDTWLNLMDQHHPCYKAFAEPPLDRTLTGEEYEQALRLVEKYGLRRLDQRQRWREWGYP
jgi:putative pyruvate formate lyase activating enzyme